MMLACSVELRINEKHKLKHLPGQKRDLGMYQASSRVASAFLINVTSILLLFVLLKVGIKGYRPCRRPLMVFYGRRRRNHETIAGGYGQLGDQCAVCEPFSAL